MNPYSSTSSKLLSKLVGRFPYLLIIFLSLGKKLDLESWTKITMNYSLFFSYKTQPLYLPVLAYFFSRRHFQIISFYPSSSLSPIPTASFPTLFHSHLIPVRGIGLCPSHNTVTRRKDLYYFEFLVKVPRKCFWVIFSSYSFTWVIFAAQFIHFLESSLPQTPYNLNIWTKRHIAWSMVVVIFLPICFLKRAGQQVPGSMRLVEGHDA